MRGKCISSDRAGQPSPTPAMRMRAATDRETDRTRKPLGPRKRTRPIVEVAEAAALEGAGKTIAAFPDAVSSMVLPPPVKSRVMRQTPVVTADKLPHFSGRMAAEPGHYKPAESAPPTRILGTSWPQRSGRERPSRAGATSANCPITSVRSREQS